MRIFCPAMASSDSLSRTAVCRPPHSGVSPLATHLRAAHREARGRWMLCGPRPEARCSQRLSCIPACRRTRQKGVRELRATGTVCQTEGDISKRAACVCAGRRTFPSRGELRAARQGPGSSSPGPAVRHFRILVTRPEPTVRPPSRMAKPRPSSMAIGWISSTVISVLSPGMTISVPSGSVMTPVTSVVRK